MQESIEATLNVLEWLTTLFVFAIGTGLLIIIGIYVRDVTQSRPCQSASPTGRPQPSAKLGKTQKRAFS